MDPISITGTAVGVASLGIQLIGSLTSYLGAVKSCREDVAAATRQVDNLQSLIKAMGPLLQTQEARNQPTSVAVATSFQQCEVELKYLEDFLAKLTDSPQATSLAGGASIRQAIKEGKKKMTYPFHRDRIDAIDKKVRAANAVLITALQALNIDVSTTVTRDISTVKIATNTLIRDAADLKKEIHTSSQQTTTKVSDDLSSIETRLQVSSRETTETMSLKVEDLGAQVDLKFEALKYDIEAIPLALKSSEESHSACVLTAVKGLQQNVVASSQVIVEQIKRGHDEQRDKLRELFLESFRQVARENPEMALVRTIGKPDYQRELLETYDNPRIPKTLEADRELTCVKRSNLSSSAGRFPFCTCLKRHIRARQQRRWGSLVFRRETTTESFHLPGCPYIHARPDESEFSYRVTYTGLVQLLSKGIEIAFSLRNGAGGRSIGPTLTSFTMVDRKKSPVFALTTLIQSGLCNLGKLDKLNSDKFAILMSSYIRRVWYLFRNRKASVNDYTEHGDSILDATIRLVLVALQTCQESWESFRSHLASLIVSGADLDPEVSRMSPFQRFLFDGSASIVNWEQFYFELADLGNLLCPSTMHQLDRLANDELRGLVALLQRSSKIRVASGCGPIIDAVLRRDERDLWQLLQHPKCNPVEISVHGHTPLHMAIFWPRGLQVLLESGKYDSDILIHARDASYSTALELAATVSRKVCSAMSESEPCTDCECYKSVDLLLQHGSSMLPFCRVMVESSLRVKRTLLEYAMKRRLQLRELALTRFPNAASAELVNDNLGIPDSNVEMILRALSMKGVALPSYLSMDFTDTELQPIYHIIDDAQTAEYAYSLGFWGIDSLHHTQNYTSTPLSSSRDAKYSLWLIRHHADILRPLQHHLWQYSGSPRQTRTMSVGHWVMSNSLYWLSRWTPEEIELLEICCCLQVQDECVCGCTLSGCHPITCFITAYWRYQYRLTSGNHSKDALTLDIIRLFEDAGLDLTNISWIPYHCIRFFTFDALGLSHTCCGQDTYTAPIVCMNDRYRIRYYQEDETHEVFENLLESLEETFRTSTKSLLEFMKSYWRKEVDAALEEINSRKMTEEERRKAEELGVVWGPEELIPVAASEEPEVRDFKYWMERMDEIVEDPGE